MNKVKCSDIRNIRGIDVEVRTIHSFTYRGNWETSGYDIHLGLKKIGHFWSWLTDSNLTRLIQKEMIVA